MLAWHADHLWTYFPKLFERCGDQIEECLYGLESSFWTYQAACRDSTTPNDKDTRQYFIDADIPPYNLARVMDVLARHGDLWNKIENGEIHRMMKLPNIYDPNLEEIISDVEDEEAGYPSGAAHLTSQDDAKMDDETGGTVEPDQEDEPMEQPTKRRRIEGVERLAEKCEAFLEESRRVELCLHCYGNQFINECELAEAKDTMAYYEGFQERLKDGTIGEPTAAATSAASKAASSSAPPPRKATGSGEKSDHSKYAPRDTGVFA
eukprot:s3768_g7.t1